MIIQRAATNDWKEIWELMTAFGKQSDQQSALSRFEEFADNDYVYLAVARMEGHMAGYVYAQDFGEHIRTGKKICRLHDLYVAPEFRRNGIAKGLMKETEKWAKERGASWLQWNAGSTAAEFYQKAGYELIEFDTEYPEFEVCFDYD